MFSFTAHPNGFMYSEQQAGPNQSSKTDKKSFEMVAKFKCLGMTLRYEYCKCKEIREEQRLRVFENRVLRRIFGSKRDGVTGEWRKLHKEELHDLYCSPNTVPVIIEKNEMGGACSAYGGEERRIQGFGGET